jgi:hypothetical protein
MRQTATILATLLFLPAVTAVAPLPGGSADVGAPEPRICAPGEGCFFPQSNFPLYVDERGDTMSGILVMDADIVMNGTHQVRFQSGQIGVVGTTDDQPLQLRANNLTLLELRAAAAGPSALSLGTVQSFADLDLGGNGLLLAAGRLDSPDGLDLQWNGATVCTAANACASVGTVTRLETGPGLAGGPVTTQGTIRVGEDAVTSAMVQDGTLGVHDLAFDPVTQEELDGIGAGPAWQLGGNLGTAPGTHFLGTLDGRPLEVRVGNQRALLLVPGSGAPQVVAGAASNAADVGAQGAAIGGGKDHLAAGPFATIAGGDGNRALHPRSTVGGGEGNEAGGPYATVPGGRDNLAGTGYAFAAGRQAKALHQGSFVWADARGFDLATTARDQFLVRATGGATFVSAIQPNGQAAAGVTLPPGAGAWSTLSDRASKEDIRPVDPRGVLEQLMSVPVATWSYRSQDGVAHMGPMAQDFAAAFGLGEDPARISTVDADGVALAAIQGLYGMVQEKEQRIDALEARLAALERALAASP